MRVYLRGRDVGMSEHRLHRAEVRTIFEQVRRKRVSDDMRRDLARDAGFRRVLLDHALHGARRQAWQVFALVRLPLTVRDKKCVAHIAALFEIFGDGLFCGGGEEDDAHFFTLAADREFVAREVEVLIQIAELRDAQSGRKEKLEYRAIAERLQGVARWRAHDAVQLICRDEVEVARANLRQLDALWIERFDIALAEEFKKSAKRDEVVILRILFHRAAHTLRAIEGDAEFAHHLFRYLTRLRHLSKTDKAREIAVVILDGFDTAPSLNFQIFKELRFERLQVCGHGFILPDTSHNVAQSPRHRRLYFGERGHEGRTYMTRWQKYKLRALWLLYQCGRWASACGYSW